RATVAWRARNWPATWSPRRTTWCGWHACWRNLSPRNHPPHCSHHASCFSISHPTGLRRPCHVFQPYLPIAPAVVHQPAKRRCAPRPSSPNCEILRAHTEHLATLPHAAWTLRGVDWINCVAIWVIAHASIKGETGCASYDSGESCLPICRVVLLVD